MVRGYEHSFLLVAFDKGKYLVTRGKALGTQLVARAIVCRKIGDRGQGTQIDASDIFC